MRSMKKLDLTNDDNKRRLVDTFVNSVYLYDDNKAVVSFNCRKGASTLVIPVGECSACARLGKSDTRKCIVKWFFACKAFSPYLEIL